MKELERAIESAKFVLRNSKLYHIERHKEALCLVVKAAELTTKYKQLCINAEACKHCCPCPHREFCPQEPLYQEIKSKLGIESPPDTALAKTEDGMMDETRNLDITLPKESWNIIDLACREHNMTVEETLVVVVLSGFLNLEKFMRGEAKK